MITGIILTGLILEEPTTTEENIMNGTGTIVIITATIDIAIKSYRPFTAHDDLVAGPTDPLPS